MEKNTGRSYSQIIISFHPEEKITYEQVLEFGNDFVRRMYPEHQALVVVHYDRDHYHCHIIINTVSFENGKKICHHKDYIYKQMEVVNNMCRERGLTVAEKGKHFDGTDISKFDFIEWNKKKYWIKKKQEEYRTNCIESIESIMESCDTKELFCLEMAELGWNVKWNRKKIVLENDQGYAIDNVKLSDWYNVDLSIDALTSVFEKNAQRQKKTEIKLKTYEEDYNNESIQLRGSEFGNGSGESHGTTKGKADSDVQENGRNKSDSISRTIRAIESRTDPGSRGTRTSDRNSRDSDSRIKEQDRKQKSDYSRSSGEDR